MRKANLPRAGWRFATQNPKVLQTRLPREICLGDRGICREGFAWDTVNSADVGLDWNFLCVFSEGGPFGSGFDLGHQLYSTASRN